MIVARGVPRRRALLGSALLAAAVTTALLPDAAPASAATVAVPASFSFSGAGWGHGVGMSQYGARGMALDGYTGEQIAEHYYTGTTVAPVTDSMDIRINVLHHRASAVFRTESLGTGGGGIAVQLTGKPVVIGDTKDIFTVTATSKAVSITRTRAGVTTSLGTGTLATVRWAGTRNPQGSGTGPTVLNLTTSVAGLASSGHRYRYGSFDFGTTTASPTTLEAVNSVRVHDEYLLGIGEVSSSWPTQSLRAQILASRSYALNKVASGVRAACRCNADGGHGPYYDQTFLGYLKETSADGALWRAAVLSTTPTATTGEAILYGGKAIAAYYFAASGGMTQSSKDVWGGALPYATSVDDHWSLGAGSPWAAWTPRVKTQAQVAAAFHLPNVVRIDLSSRLASGALKTATAYSSSGAKASISGGTFASRLSLPSSWVWRTVSTSLSAIVTAAARTASSLKSTTVVIAPSGSPAAIAVANVLAVRKGWPLLLSTGATLPAATVADLTRRKVARAVVVGTAAEAPAALLTALTRLGAVASRITGATESDVSVVAARAGAYASGSVALVASTTDRVATALASAAAARSGRPMLLLPGGAASSASVTGYLTTIKTTRSVVIGPTTVVAATALASLPHALRVGGSTPGAYTDAVLSTLGTRVPPRIVVATPTTALAGLLAARGLPLAVLSTTVTPYTATYLQRGIPTIIAPNGTTAAIVTAARRA